MSNHISITKILLYHSRNYNAVWSSLPGIRGKDQVYLLQHRFQPQIIAILNHKNKTKNEAQFEKYQNLDMAEILELSHWKLFKNSDWHANDSNAKYRHHEE